MVSKKPIVFDSMIKFCQNCKPVTHATQYWHYICESTNIFVETLRAVFDKMKLTIIGFFLLYGGYMCLGSCWHFHLGQAGQRLESFRKYMWCIRHHLPYGYKVHWHDIQPFAG